jgi:hypothetical protein
MRTISLVTVALGTLATVAHAETSLEYAKRSQLAWSAFECSALAQTMGNFETSQRLFDLGYVNAKTFMEAAAAGKVASGDIFSTTPYGMTSVMHGPNIDFKIGRLWEQTAKSSHKKVFENADGATTTMDTWKWAASQEYRARNCDLLK